MTTFQRRHAAGGCRQLYATRWVVSCSCGQKYYGRTRRWVERRLGQHIALDDRALCPTPRKTAYGNRLDAERKIPQVWRGLQGGPPLHPYECVCGRWHLTKSVPNA